MISGCESISGKSGNVVVIRSLYNGSTNGHFAQESKNNNHFVVTNSPSLSSDVFFSGFSSFIATGPFGETTMMSSSPFSSESISTENGSIDLYLVLRIIN